MMTATFPYITCAMALLLLCACGVKFAGREALVLPIAFGGTLPVLALSLFVLAGIEPDEAAAAALAEQITLPGLRYPAELDEFNILFFPLIAVLVPLLLVFLRTGSTGANRRQIIGVILYEIVLLGAVSAQSLVQFWLWLAVEIIPLRMLLDRPGNDGGEIAATVGRYWRLMLALLLGGILVLASGNTGTLAFILLFFGLATRLPVFPFHGWLPVIVQKGNSIALFCLLAGAKISVIGLYRFALPLADGVPDAWFRFIELLALFSIFYGALLALMQISIYRLLAFAVVSHNGMLVIGLLSRNMFGLEGSLLLSIAFGLASAGMILSTGFVRQQTGTVFIPRLGNLFESNTFTAILFLLAALSTMAMPGTPGYNAAHLLLEGVIEENGWGIAIAILIGNVLAAAFLLRAFQQVFIASSRRAPVPLAAGVLPRGELLVSGVICLLLLVTGFVPMTMIMGL